MPGRAGPALPVVLVHRLRLSPCPSPPFCSCHMPLNTKTRRRDHHRARTGLNRGTTLLRRLSRRHTQFTRYRAHPEKLTQTSSTSFSHSPHGRLRRPLHRRGSQALTPFPVGLGSPTPPGHRLESDCAILGNTMSTAIRIRRMIFGRPLAATSRLPLAPREPRRGRTRRLEPDFGRLSSPPTTFRTPAVRARPTGPRR